MSKTIGTISRGIKAPIIRPGDDLVKIVSDCVISAANENNIVLREKDVVCVTEAVVAKAENNFATVDQIADDIKAKFPGGVVGVIFPILSRNRFAVCLKAVARGAKKIILCFSYPSDEVGNCLIEDDKMQASGLNPYTDILSLRRYRELFGENLHPFTQVDYVDYYKEIIEAEGAICEIIFANFPEAILDYTKDVLCCDIHSRERTKLRLRDAGAENVLGLDDILNKPINGSGCNEKYGLLGSNKSTEESVKLFPRKAEVFVESLQQVLLEQTGKLIEVMVYGDGAFKDPVGKIWELADPVVSPAFTKGLCGLPNELKLKYIADNELAGLTGEAARSEMEKLIRQKKDLMGSMLSQGTTPRRLCDLLGSLCDLTSGSGDKGTPIVLIQNYFDNYAD